jgi:beta-fructofuranosidase
MAPGTGGMKFSPPAFCGLLAGMAAFSLAAAEKPEPGFKIHLDGVELGYPGVERWAQIECPDGQRIWSFAIYQGKSEWTAPVQAATAGKYRLLRLESRDGEKRQAIALGANSQTELNLSQEDLTPATEPGETKEKTLVQAGEFQTIFTAAEPWCVNDHTFVQGPDKTWHLFGITHPKPFDFAKDPGLRLAHATASHLLQGQWTAQEPAVTADWAKYHEALLWAPYVFRDGPLYYMFVSAGDKNSHRYALHLLTSPDLENWTRSPENPMVVDGFDTRDPMVMRVGGQWVLYYTATTTPEGGNHIVACVMSQDLIHWTNRTVALMHPSAGTFGGPTESPFVVQRGGSYYLFVCDNDWTDVYVSGDPLHWDYGAKAGRIQSHASEIVRDTDGQWYFSNTGWMNGPVSLAPLRWHDGLDAAPSNIKPGVE